MRTDNVGLSSSFFGNARDKQRSGLEKRAFTGLATEHANVSSFNVFIGFSQGLQIERHGFSRVYFRAI
jgi:hypothetical protein